MPRVKCENSGPRGFVLAAVPKVSIVRIVQDSNLFIHSKLNSYTQHPMKWNNFLFKFDTIIQNTFLQTNEQQKPPKWQCLFQIWSIINLQPTCKTPTALGKFSCVFHSPTAWPVLSGAENLAGDLLPRQSRRQRLRGRRQGSGHGAETGGVSPVAQGWEVNGLIVLVGSWCL